MISCSFHGYNTCDSKSLSVPPKLCQNDSSQSVVGNVAGFAIWLNMPYTFALSLLTIYALSLSFLLFT